MKNFYTIFTSLFIVAFLFRLAGYPFSNIMIIISTISVAITFLINQLKQKTDRVTNIMLGITVTLLLITFIFKKQYWMGYEVLLYLLIVQTFITSIYLIKKKINFLTIFAKLYNIKLGLIILIISFVSIILPHSQVIYIDEFILKRDFRFEENKCNSYRRYFTKLEEENKYDILESEIIRLNPIGCDYKNTKETVNLDSEEEVPKIENISYSPINTEFEIGYLDKQSFKNSHFGFSILIPEEWEILNKNVLE